MTVGARAREGETPRTDVTRAVIAAMTAEGVRRLVVQSSYGVGDFVPAAAGRPRGRRQSPKGSGCTVTPRQKAT